MNQVFKTGLSIFLMFLAALVLSAIITADSQAQAAKKYAQDVTKEIESANLSDNVINVCIQTAAASGYILSVDKMTDETGKTVICEVVLKYDYSIPVLKMTSHHECRSFAR